MTSARDLDERPHKRRIPPPTGERLPLKSNIFEAAHSTAANLTPMFPYQGEGAIMPCIVVQYGAPGKDQVGTFFHGNLLDEVALVFGAKGPGLQTGQAFVGHKVHGVNTFLRNPTDAKSFNVLAVVQRQFTGSPQPETIIFRCQKCAAELMREEFDALPDPSARYPSFGTLRGSVEAHQRYNADEARRTCAKCGHVSKPFPIGAWGWERYLAQGDVVNHARRLMEDAARAALAEG